MYAGLPTKDETSETTVWNVFCFFRIFMVPCNCKLVFFLESLNKPLNDCYATKSSRSELPLHAKDVKPLKSRGKQVRTAATKLVLICKLYLIYLYCVRQLSSVTLNILIQKYYCCDLLIAH